jgi:hypothetical protein
MSKKRIISTRFPDVSKPATRQDWSSAGARLCLQDQPQQLRMEQRAGIISNLDVLAACCG